jgi:transcriptional regulator with XRE-family HTH domain
LIRMSWADYGRKRLEELVRGHGQKAALARAAGVDGGTVTRWLSGEYVPSADQLEAICRHVGISADRLLGLDATAQSPDEIAHRLEVSLRESQTYTKLLIERTRK